MRKTIRLFRKKIKHAKMVVGFMLNKKSFLSQPSYYDEDKRKSNLRITFEIICHIWKYGEVNQFYYAYGLDQKGRKSDGYMAYSDFMEKRNKMNYTRPFDYLCILRDKNIFSIVAEAFHIPSPLNLCTLCNGSFLSQQANFSEKDLWKDTDSLFVKAITGECGQKVLNIKYQNGGGYLINNTFAPSWRHVKDYLSSDEFKNVEFVVQKCLKNHPVIDRIYPQSINTIRLVTIKNPKTNKVEPFAAILRIGAHGHSVDNWAMGGLAIKINNDGTLAPEAYYKPGYGTKTKTHPDTDILFENIKVPHFDECIHLCCKYHEKLAIHSIGWDVAITIEGPVIIEGNDNWEISLMQVPCGPLQSAFINTL